MSNPVGKPAILALLVLATAGCSSFNEPEPRLASVAGGDDQAAPVELTLATPVSLQVTALDGTPLPRVPVDWELEQGGNVEPVDMQTDSTGVARARWQLGSRTGDQYLIGRVPGAEPVRFRARALRPDSLHTVFYAPGGSPFTDSLRLVIRTSEEWDDLWLRYTGAGAPREINFDRYMVIVATRGWRPRGGYRIWLDSISAGPGRFEVHLSKASGQGLAPQVPTAPAHMAIHERLDGEAAWIETVH